MRFHWQPKQRQIVDLFLETGPTVATRLGFGGSRGSAKSRLGRDLALFAALKFPGKLIYVVARNFINLDDNYLKKYEIERPEIMEHYRASPHPEITLPPDMGGSVIAFRYADTVKDMTRLERGPEAFLIIVEQAESFTAAELQQITKPNRWPNEKIGAPKTVYLFNPGGPGTEYLQRVFFLKQFSGTERPSDFHFTQSYGWDNWAWFEQVCPELTEEQFYALPGDIPACPDGVYDDAWLATVADNHRFKLFVTRTSEGQKYWALPESMRMGDLFGRFDQFAGQYFSGVWKESLCVLPTRIVDALVKYWWTAWCGGDLGFGHHTAIYWAAIGKISPSEAWDGLAIDTEWPLDIVVIYRELVPPQRTPEGEIARMMVDVTPKAERDVLRAFVMGSDTKTTDRYATHSRRELIDAVTVPAGFPPIRSAQDQPGSRVINARLLFEMLRRTCSMRGENPPRERPEEKTPPMLLISVECPKLIAAIPMMITDEKKPDDFAKQDTLSDDVIDGAKYVCAEHAGIQLTAPRSVRRTEAMESAAAHGEEIGDKVRANTARYHAMLKFDQDEEQQERRGRRR